MRLTRGRRPGTKLNGIPIAMTANATNLDSPWKTGARIWVEKYITGVRLFRLFIGVMM